MRSGRPTEARPGRGVRRRRRPWVTALALSLMVPVGLAPTADAAGRGLGRPDVPDQRVSKVKEVSGPGATAARAHVAKESAANAALAVRATAERRADWPRAGRGTVPLTSGKAGTATVSGLPVTVTPDTRRQRATAGAQATRQASPAGGSAEVTVLDQKAAERLGLTGVLLTVAAEQPGAAEVRVGYGPVAAAVGGGWAQRLRLVQLPACALTTPRKAECRRQTPVATRNDLASRTVSARGDLPQADSGMSAQLAAGSTVLAMTASGAGQQSPPGPVTTPPHRSPSPSPGRRAAVRDRSPGPTTSRCRRPPPTRRPCCPWATTRAASTAGPPRPTTSPPRWARASR